MTHARLRSPLVSNTGNSENAGCRNLDADLGQTVAEVRAINRCNTYQSWRPKAIKKKEYFHVFDQIKRLPSDERSVYAAGVLAAASVIGSLNYTHYTFWVFQKQTSFVPDLASGILAFLLLLPLLRGNLLHSERLDPPTALCLLLLFYLFSIVVKMGLVGASFASMFTKSPTFLLILFVAITANFNAQRYGELALLGVIIIGGYNIFTVSEAMGFSGWAFITLFAVGALLTLDLSKLVGKAHDTT